MSDSKADVRVMELPLEELTGDRLLARRIALTETIRRITDTSSKTPLNERSLSAIVNLLLAATFASSVCAAVKSACPPFPPNGEVSQSDGYLFVDLWGRSQGVSEILSQLAERDFVVVFEEAEALEVLANELVSQLIEIMGKFAALGRFGAALDLLRS